MNSLQLKNTPLDIAAIHDLVADESCGAISLFVGTTRDNFDDKKVISLEYEAYETMAIKQMEVICDEIRTRWKDVHNIAIYHRLGLVPVKEASVIIAISSPHRQSALESVDFSINELKSRVPIWKKERYDNDESTWKENKESTSQSLGVKRPKLQFADCRIQDVPVSQNLVQIAVKDDELQRRIKCFVEKKREEIDANNVIDFTLPSDIIKDNNNTEISGCARTNSVIVKQEHSKCHLRVRKVDNQIGPQTKPDYLQTLDKLMTVASCNLNLKQEYKNEASSSLKQRIAVVEEYLNLPNADKNIYKRIKLLEDRLLYLESISPEYKHFLASNTSMPPVSEINQKKANKIHLEQKHKTYNVDDLNVLIEEIENAESNGE